MNIYFIAAIIVSAIIVILLFWFIVRLNNRINAFTRGQNGALLEQVIKNLIQSHEQYIERHHELVTIAKQISNRVATSHRGFSIHRFNAYEHTGGNQSFCAAFIDESGNGMVLSSLYSRERSNVFAKPITKFKCEFELTHEEKKVLEAAQVSLAL